MNSKNREIVKDEELKEIIPDLPVGRLDEFRKKATFDWRRMKLLFESKDSLAYKYNIWNFFANHPIFQHKSTSLSLDEDRHLAVKRMYTLFDQKFYTSEMLVNDPQLLVTFIETVFSYDSSLSVKWFLTFEMFKSTIRGSGSPHHYDYIEDSDAGKISGCFALTEVSHGSNAKGIRTTATYCPEKKMFILHSPDFEAAKFWVGCLGKQATHALVYAKLISKGVDHGLNLFVVPIRDPKTLKPYPGVIVGDIGEKIGLNGLDNGFVMFNDYYISKQCALDKMGGVDDNGDYKTPFRDPNKRFGASLGILSGGRVQITSISTVYLQKAIVIAVRYSAVRKQFGPDDSDAETPVLMYQQQQIRLLPYLAATYALKAFSTTFSVLFVKMTLNNMLGIEDRSSDRGIEIHALSSAAKPLCSWMSRDGIQNCREACGGHGYLKAAEIGDLRNDNDANCTYEGENSVIVQQASKFLLAMWPLRRSEAVDLPYGSLDFMVGADDRLQQTCQCRTVEDMVRPENLMSMYNWLAAYMLKITYDKVESMKREGKNDYEAKNDSQSYYAVTLATVYAENFVLKNFYNQVVAFDDENCKRVVMKLVALFGAFLLEKHLGTLYAGGYLSGDQGLLIREGVLRLCASVSPEAVALADTLAPHDICMKSVLGQADGEVYKHIQNNVMTYPGSMSRPRWWKDVVDWESYVRAKL